MTQSGIEACTGLLEAFPRLSRSTSSIHYSALIWLEHNSWGGKRGKSLSGIGLSCSLGVPGRRMSYSPLTSHVFTLHYAHTVLAFTAHNGTVSPAHLLYCMPALSLWSLMWQRSLTTGWPIFLSFLKWSAENLCSFLFKSQLRMYLLSSKCFKRNWMRLPLNLLYAQYEGICLSYSWLMSTHPVVILNFLCFFHPLIVSTRWMSAFKLPWPKAPEDNKWISLYTQLNW